MTKHFPPPQPCTCSQCCPPSKPQFPGNVVHDTIPGRTVLGNANAKQDFIRPLSQAQLTDLVNVFTPTLKGLVPAPGTGTPGSYVLTASGKWTQTTSLPSNPISVGASAPPTRFLWFNTSTNILSVWDQSPSVLAWVPVLLTGVIFGFSSNYGQTPTPPFSPGQLWLDSIGWLRVWDGNNWQDITQPVPGIPVPTSTTSVVVSLDQPSPASVSQLWIRPCCPSLNRFDGARWIKIGVRPARSLVRVSRVPGGILPTATWSLGVRDGDYYWVAGMRGIDPVTNLQVDVSDGGYARVLQAFRNMKNLVVAEGGTLWDCVRLIVTVTNMAVYRPLVNQVQALDEFWGVGPYPNRRIFTAVQLNGTDTVTEGGSTLPRGDIAEIEGTFYMPRRGGQTCKHG